MTKDDIKFGTHHLHYKSYGNGRYPLIAFHGFGQSSEYFQHFSEKLGHLYTIYALDLFFHGDSHWGEKEEVLKKEELKEMLEIFLQKHQIKSFAICGYSMGGKFALACIELFPDRISQCLLIAPDGIKTSFWYSLATYPQVFRYLFKQIIKKPDIFYKITKWAKLIGIVDKSILKFAKSQMKTELQRERVYYTWVIFRELKFNLTDISNIINLQAIPLLMVTGTYDKIISSKNMHLLLDRLNNYEDLILPTGHNQLITETADYLSEHLELLKFKSF